MNKYLLRKHRVFIHIPKFIQRLCNEEKAVIKVSVTFITAILKSAQILSYGFIERTVNESFLPPSFDTSATTVI